ncbi:MFS transporter [Brevibacillus dissolubilis]|uniref:MFS transporter n=1 Tax=Brevibacillus dissolubilis TaxID=1844116 RepID=UPI001117A2C5|nr:MFS transporter [Brevibacillus dissolubilis]
MLTIFRNRNYTRLFLASFTSQMGGVIGLTALMFYLLDRYSNQPVYATVTELMLSLPTLAVFFLVGVFADRLDRQQITVYCDWICAVVSLLLLGSLLIDWIPLTFALLFIRSAVKSFFSPAQAALVQGVLVREEYSTAVGLNQMVASLFMLFGSGLGIFCYWTLGITGAILADVISFVISGLLIQSCSLSEQVRMPNGKHSIRDLHIGVIWNDFKTGLRYILQHKLLMALIAGFVLFGIVNGGLSVMQVFLLKYKLAPDNYEQISIYLGIVFGVGFLLGSIVATKLVQKLKPHHMLFLALMVSGGATVTGSLVPTVWLYFICSGLIAMSLPVINVAIGGWVPKIVEPTMMGRVQGWISPLMMLSQSGALLFIATFYPALLTIETLYWMVGGCLITVGVFYLLTLPRFMEAKQPEEVKQPA